MLWPLGGLAYVVPPPRPGPTLFSFAAGPLVNAALCPIFAVLWWRAWKAGWALTQIDAYGFVHAVFWINVILLVTNILPIFPLDGGQMLRRLLWFVVGKARSLMATAVLGVVAVVGLIATEVIQIAGQRRIIPRIPNQEISHEARDHDRLGSVDDGSCPPIPGKAGGGKMEALPIQGRRTL